MIELLYGAKPETLLTLRDHNFAVALAHGGTDSGGRRVAANI